MNKETAEIIITIMLSADDNCKFCAGHLIGMFVEKFGFKKEAELIFKEHFGLELYE